MVVKKERPRPTDNANKEQETAHRRCTSDEFLQELDQRARIKFAGTLGKIDARYLFSSDGVHRFRLNWWRDEKISFSVFVKVEDSEDGLIFLEEEN